MSRRKTIGSSTTNCLAFWLCRPSQRDPSRRSRSDNPCQKIQTWVTSSPVQTQGECSRGRLRWPRLSARPGTCQATPQPITAGLPLTFPWDNGTLGSTAAYSWSMTGTYVHLPLIGRGW